MRTHVVNGFLTLPVLLAQEQVDPAHRTREVLGGTPVEAGRAALQAAVDALGRPGALDVVVTAPPGVMPAGMLTMIRMADTVIHTWDLAAGAGLDRGIPTTLVEAVLAASPPAFLDAARQAGVFGPARDIDPDAGPQTRLLALYGRSVVTG